MSPHGVLPFPAPARCPWRRGMKLDRAGVRAAAQHIAAANKPKGTVVEVIDAEIVDDRSTGPTRHVGIQVNVLAEKSRNVTLRLIRVVPAYHSGFGRGVVGFADPGEQQHADVVEG